MTIFAGVTCILVVLKVCKQIDCSWWLVFSPAIIEVVFFWIIFGVIIKLIRKVLNDE